MPPIEVVQAGKKSKGSSGTRLVPMHSVRFGVPVDVLEWGEEECSVFSNRTRLVLSNMPHTSPLPTHDHPQTAEDLRGHIGISLISMCPLCFWAAWG